MHQFTELKYLRFQFYDILNGIKTCFSIFSIHNQFQFYDVNGIKIKRIDPNSPLTKLVDKLWNSKEDYIPTEEEIEQFNKEMKEYHRNKNKKD